MPAPGQLAPSPVAPSLLAAAQSFAAAYHARPDLVRDNLGWSPTVVLSADDTGATVTIVVRDGRVASIDSSPAPARPLRRPPGPGGPLIITADEPTLRDILLLQQSPNEPYLFGELIVHGSEADFLRLDYLTTALCPAT